MSSALPVAPLAAAPFEVYSVHFDFPGGQAIDLRDPVSDHRIGVSPEWVSGGRSELAAYVRGTRPDIRVVFRGTPGANGNYTVGADGTPFQVEARGLALAFDPGTGLSNSELFRAAGALPGAIGVHAVKLDWYVRPAPSPAHCQPAGTSTHRVATSWRKLATAPAGTPALAGRVFVQVMGWTCEWAAGLDDEKEICDAIIANLPKSNLKYGVHAESVREMFLNGGGMCGRWYLMFQQMAQAQGVFVHCRCFLVDWRQIPGGEERWCALVVRNGGVNQPVPTHTASEFNDHDGPFPAAVLAITRRTEPRYRFWGVPGYYGDGHCVNFLAYGGRHYLYDPCFATGPVPIEGPLPPDDFSVWGGPLLASFKSQYLDHAVDYMLGSLYDGIRLLKSRDSPLENGVTVRTSQIPETVNGSDGLTFYWGG